MIDPKPLADALVTKLRAIPLLVAELGSADQIYAYEDAFPSSTSIDKAVRNEVKDGDLMVVWNGTAKGTAQGRTVWLHRFSLVAKGVNFSNVWKHVANSPVTGETMNFRYIEIYSGCYPLFADIGAERKSLFVSEYTTLDYLEMPLTLTERAGL